MDEDSYLVSNCIQRSYLSTMLSYVLGFSLKAVTSLCSVGLSVKDPEV